MEGLSETSRFILKSFRPGNCDPTVSSRYLIHTRRKTNNFSSIPNDRMTAVWQ
jgi:hypothetical protein